MRILHLAGQAPYRTADDERRRMAILTEAVRIRDILSIGIGPGQVVHNIMGRGLSSNQVVELLNRCIMELESIGVQNRPWFVRRWIARWRSRGYNPADHEDCSSFLGPCNRCREHQIGQGLPDPWKTP